MKIESQPYIKIEKAIIDSFKSFVKVNNAKFHHNRNYDKIPSILKNGILSKNEQVKLYEQTLTRETELKFIDDYHVNGLDHISLANMEIDFNNVGKNELIYDPYDITKPDILISSDIKAYRNSRNYANEYLAQTKIDPCYFKAIDVRILRLFEELNKEYEKTSDIKLLNNIIDKFEQLKLIAQAILDLKLDINLREMSYENVNLDIEKLANSDIFILKKMVS